MLKSIITVLLILGSVTVGYGQSIYEDKNNNGVFDTGDVDITSRIMADQNYSSDFSIVIAKSITQRCEECHIVMMATKISILPNVTLTSIGKGSQVYLRADDLIINSGAQVSAKHHVELHGKRINVGDNVRLQATGSNPSYGYGTIYMVGNEVTIGSRFSATAYETVEFHATAGSLVVGPRATIISRASGVGLHAIGVLDLQNASMIRGDTDVFLQSENGVVRVRNSRVVSPVLIVMVGGIIEGDFKLFTKPYVIFNSANPGGVYTTK